MAIANLNETLLFYKMERNRLNLEITQLQSQKSLGTYSQADIQSLKSAETRALRSKYKDEFDADAALQEKYKDYTEMPDFEAELDKLTAKFQDQFDELTAWETNIGNSVICLAIAMISGSAQISIALAPEFDAAKITFFTLLTSKLSIPAIIFTALFSLKALLKLSILDIIFSFCVDCDKTSRLLYIKI